MEEQQNIIKISRGDKFIILKLPDFDVDIDMDDILKIDYTNILGEVLTFSAILNRIGILRAEMDDAMAKAKFALEVYKAKLSEMYRKSLVKKTVDEKGKTKVKLPTNPEVENAVLLDKGYQLRMKTYLRTVRNYNEIDSFYWSARDKAAKLDNASISLKPEDFEKQIIEGVINGVKIKMTEKLIK